MKLVELETQDGITVWLNPNQIIELRQSETPGHTDVTYIGMRVPVLVVRGDLEEIAFNVDEALNAS